MGIPDFQTIMGPLLDHLSDGKPHSTAETLEDLAHRFQLSDAERKQLLPSGTQPLFTNRVAWAKFYLKKAGAVIAPKKGVYQITERGRSLLGGKVDVSSLQQFSEFNEFIAGGKKAAPDGSKPGSPSPSGISNGKTVATPAEMMEAAHQQTNERLSAEILDQIKQASPSFFERLVVDLMLAMGYGGARDDAGQIVGKSGDEGIDGVIKEDRLGLNMIYIQAKRWQSVVGRPEVQKFAGALQGQRAKKGVFITTSSFTKEAAQYAETIDNRIVLIDGDQLAHLMIERNVGVAVVANYEIKRVDSDYFVEDQ